MIEITIERLVIRWSADVPVGPQAIEEPAAPALPKPRPGAAVPQAIEAAGTPAMPGPRPGAAVPREDTDPRPSAPGTPHPALSPRRGGRGNARKLICEQIPGKLLTVEEAAKLCGRKANSVRVACSPSSPTHGRVGTYTFRYEGTDAPAPSVPVSATAAPLVWPPNPFPRETRPRGDGQAMPLNPFRRGADAPVPQDPAPCPAPNFKSRIGPGATGASQMEDAPC